jgi:hypothetical protein
LYIIRRRRVAAVSGTIDLQVYHNQKSIQLYQFRPTPTALVCLHAQAYQ